MAAGSFGSTEALRAHVQSAVDVALTEARRGNAGDIAVVLADGAVAFETGMLAKTWHSLGTFDPGFTSEAFVIESQLAQELRFAQDQLLQYPGNATLVAFYEGEINRIQGELDAEGLLDTSDPDGRVAPITRLGLGVTINAIQADAGGIDLRADQVGGSGRWIAPGDASVSIINETPAFLNLRGITISESTGGLFVNGARVEGTSLAERNADILAFNQATIEEESRSGTNVPLALVTPEFGGVAGGGGTADQPTVTVRNTFDATALPDAYSWNDITVLGGTEGLGIVAPQAELVLGTPQGGKGDVN